MNKGQYQFDANEDQNNREAQGKIDQFIEQSLEQEVERSQA